MGNLKHRMRAIPEGQEALPFRNNQQGGIFAYAPLWERRLFFGLSAAFLVVTALYIYFVMASIVHVAARQELAGKVASAKSALSTLETQYLSKSQAITEAYAHSAGFVSASRQSFVVRENTVTFHDAR